MAAIPGPMRRLVVANAVSSLGNGLWLTSGVIFLTRSAGLSPREVGVGLSTAAVVGVLAGVPIGAWADRVGPRRVVVLMFLLEGVAVAGYVVVRTLPAFLVVATAAAVGLAGSNAARGALLAGLFGVSGAARARAMVRAAANLGISVGTLGAGAVLSQDSRTAYLAMIVIDVATFVTAAAVCLTLPEVPGGPVPVQQTGRRRVAWRDRRFVTVTAVSGLMNVQYGVLTVALPLWVVTATSAPRWLVAALFFLSTTLCVALQVRAGRGLDEPSRAAQAARRAGALFLVAAVLFAAAANRSPVLGIGLLTAAVVIHTFGELLQAGSSFGLSFALAPPGAHGEYQGLWHVGAGLGEGAAPVIMTSLVIGTGVPGWCALGLLLAAAGAATPRLVRRWEANGSDSTRRGATLARPAEI